MLKLLRAYTGWPTEVSQLSLSRRSLLFYPSADTVVIVDACNLTLVRILAFWEAFPAASHVKGKLKVLCTDPGLKLILASMGTQLVFWTLSENAKEDPSVQYKIHSTLSVRDVVTAADCKSGLLAIGTTTSLAVYTLTLHDDIPTWSKKWEAAVPMLSQILLSPSLTHIASISSEHKYLIRLHLTAAPRETQSIRHPRPLLKVIWRAPKSHSRPDLTLYTLTSDSTLRVFHPVLDAPQRLQLHAALDATSFLPSSVDLQTFGSHIFPLDRQILSQTFEGVLDAPAAQKTLDEETDPRISPDLQRRLEEIRNEDWDLFLRILKDGSLVIRGVANIDRRPPTLLRQFTLLHTPPLTFACRRPPTQLIVSPREAGDEDGSLATSALTLTTCPPLTAHDFDPAAFFDGRSFGLQSVATINFEAYGVDHREEEPIEGFVRTADGNGVAVVRTSGGEAWVLEGQGRDIRLQRVGRWHSKGLIAILDGGHSTAIYDHSKQQLTLRNHTTSVEDTLAVPPLTSLFSLPPTRSHTLLIGVTTESSILQVHVPSSSVANGVPFVYSNTLLPLPLAPRLILPVDPMAWSTNSVLSQNDVLVSISSEGELAFWVPEVESSSTPEKHRGKWRCTGTVHTGRKYIRMARCSSVKKTVLVVPGPEGEEVTIWDSKESEFSSGLEYRHVSSISEPIKDLDWTSTGNAQSILAIGFAHHVILLCQQRMTYFEQEPAWGIFGKVEISHLTPHPICDSIWLANGTLLVAAGHQMFHFGQSLMDSATGGERMSLFELVAFQNGPLMDYHPQMLLQCLLWDKLELVKRVITRLATSLEETRGSHILTLNYSPMSVDQFLKIHQQHTLHGEPRSQYPTLFSEHQDTSAQDDQEFSRSRVHRLVKLLETGHVFGLTPNEQSHLIVLVQTTLEVDEQRRALDSNGLRYLISMRSFYILNQRAISPKLADASPKGRRRLRYRDMLWAFHSQSQEILLAASTAACGGKMIWDDAKALGIVLWIDSTESLRNQIEVIARNEYMTGEDRDPTVCALYYFALGKAVMLKFLSNDFQQARWKTAALKNAYALLGKQRFAYAAAFFLLGGSLKDAVNVCVKQLEDFQLAVALSRVVEQGDEGTVFKELLRTIVIPLAFKEGNRWLGSWAFWKLHRRDLAVRILLTPLNELATSLDILVTEVGDPHYDDPSLALLFSQLKLKSLQTAKGTSEISGRTEFNFVLQMARVFCRMGCHALALDLATSWSFERPAARETPQAPTPTEPSTLHESQPSSTFNRRFDFHLRRRSSMVIDMEIPSLPPTQPATPTEKRSLQDISIPEEPSATDGKECTMYDSERQAGLGKLMKSAKQHVSVPEFDINAFF